MGRVVSGNTGMWLLCCFDDCGRYGLEEFKVQVPEGAKVLNYVFCGARHRLYYLNAREHGNLPSGTRGVDGHVQGVTLPRTA